MMLSYNSIKEKRYFISFLFGTLFIFGCNGGSMNLNDEIAVLNYYNNGQIKKIDSKEYNIEECFNSISEQFSLLITSQEINKIKENEHAIEFIFKKSMKYTIKPIDKKKIFNKAFVPLSGKYEKILFLGNESGYGAYTPYGLMDCSLITSYTIPPKSQDNST